VAAACCPDPELLQQWHGGLAEVRSDRELSTHVSSCPTCRSELAELSRADELLLDLRQVLPDGVRPAPGPEPPERVGGYRLLREVGHGGMGVVYLAEQDRPHRQVALKLIHPHGLSPRALRRFELEVEVLGRLEHPAIARIFEAGTARIGRADQPFFSMEYVRGVRLHEHLHERSPGLDERLALFLAICEGVQHAHQRGVIHRDLKPGNVLVDEAGRPKLIDFGLARVFDADLPGASLHTEAGRVLGTLPYMAPELAGGDPAAVDLRADVYGLGAILYEMLTGRPPLDLSASPLPAALRRIETELPAPPSVANPELPRPLDWVVLKALEKDPDCRYSSARELAEDVRRFLAHEPLAAGPPGVRDAVALFVRRHRVAVGFAGVIFVLLLVALAGTSWGLLQARASAARARTAADTTDQALDFFVGLFDQADPQIALGSPPTVAQALDRSEAALQDGLHGQPVIRATVLHAIGNIDRSLGRWDRAASRLAESWSLRRSSLGDEAPDTLQAANDLARVQRDIGQAAEAEALLRQTLTTRIATLGAEDPATLDSLSELGATLIDLGRAAEAEVVLRQAAAGRHRLLGPGHADTLESEHDLALALLALGRLDEAAAAMEGVIGRERLTLEPNHPRLLLALSNLATIYTAQSRYDESIELQRQVADARASVLGPDHPYTLLSLRALGETQCSFGRRAEATVSLEAALAGYRRIRPQSHVDVLSARLLVAFNQSMLGDYASARQTYEDVLPLLPAALGPDDPGTASAQYELGSIYVNLGDLQRAEPLLMAAAEALACHVDAEALRAVQSATALGRLRSRQLRLDEAAALLRSAHVLGLLHLGASHAGTLDALSDLAGLELQAGRYLEAELLARQALAGHERAFGADCYSTVAALFLLAAALDGQGHGEAAVAGYDLAIEGFTRVDGSDGINTHFARLTRAALIGRTGHSDEALPPIERARDAFAAAFGEEHPDTLGADLELARVLLELGRTDEAASVVEAALGRADLVLPRQSSLRPMLRMCVADVRRAQGRLEEAGLAAREALREAEAAVDLLPDNALSMHVAAAHAFSALGRDEEAVALLLRAIESLGPALGEEHPEFRTLTGALAGSLATLGQADRAGELVAAAWERARTGEARAAAR
jgi:non-specific serine/threonine protein kinase/serine/threonine-protein kinase